ncbi:rho GTPase-activating protein 26-like isoform X3 [Mizuhopecten yessoensis]|uniref:rho GTPase-activating protein 26-like isoform X3 n=1 Tax=Mizuhopecten yessoensis TaxID=6573 RepID=UPI000B45CA36|nr:rho GTPase-activating protein 26-like isoform X3 [Mizuhopecten yessoensis]
MGLEPLEFAECLTDSPFFREKLHDHEKELERTSKAIKLLINDGNNLLHVAKNLGLAQRKFATKLIDFKFECIGEKTTEDEDRIAGALKEFGRLIVRVEDERDRMISNAADQFQRLEKFRKEQLGSVKEEKKSFDKQTVKICQSMERYLNLKTKVNDNMLQEADAQLEMECRGFREASMKYVLKVQEVQERKKFDFVEMILAFMYSLFTFYHEGFEAKTELNDYSSQLQKILQKTRESFEMTREQTEKLMLKTLDNRGTAAEMLKPVNQTGASKGCTREGYLYLMEKKALGVSWNKHYCWYKKENKEFHMMPYNQVAGKLIQSTTEKLILKSCVRRPSQSIEKRFCFDLTVMLPDSRQDQITFQSPSDQDRKLWMDVMDGKEPVYNAPKSNSDDSSLDDIGFGFIERCIKCVEERGLFDQGLYRVVGVSSKVSKLISLGLDPKKKDKINIEDPTQFEIKTVTSAVKHYLRSLPEPLMTFKFHSDFIAAAKQESKTLRIHDVHTLVHKLPEANFEMLELMIRHLKNISEQSDKNLMTVANLGVCFGPTLMRSEEESVAAIMDIKFLNIVVELLIFHYDKIFKTAPEGADISEIRVVPSSTAMLTERREPSSKFVPLNDHMMMASPNTGHVSHAPQPIYANKAPRAPPQSYQPGKAKLRGVEVYNPQTGGFEMATGSSTSGSSESLNSSHSNHVSKNTSSPPVNSHRKGPAPQVPGPTYSNVNALANRFNLHMTGSDVPTLTSSVPSMTGSLTGSLGGSSNFTKPKKRTVRTLYHCDAENDSELSFEPNMIITNVRPSKEPGWLEGNLDHKTGLIPENYVEYVD